jgi:pimeloyl-ACP methyl ester carboxylesterase
VRITSSGGVDLAVHDLGGEGRPLLVAHATGFLGAVYRPLADRLADAFHVWALDFRAHGDSSRTDDLGWDGMADDVLAAVDGLGLERPVAVGHSMGGAALVLAELRRPGTFAGLYLYEPVLVPAGHFPSSGDDNPMSAAARRRRPGFESRHAAYDNYASKPPLSVLTPEALRLYVDEGFAEGEGGVVLKCRPEDEAEVFRHGATNGGFERLGELDLPVTVAQGGVVDPGPGALAPLQAERIPGGRLVVAEGLGHFGPLQDPDLVAAQVRSAFPVTPPS